MKAGIVFRALRNSHRELEQGQQEHIINHCHAGVGTPALLNNSLQIQVKGPNIFINQHFQNGEDNKAADEHQYKLPAVAGTEQHEKDNDYMKHTPENRNVTKHGHNQFTSSNRISR